MRITKILFFIFYFFSIQNCFCQNDIDRKIDYYLNKFQYDSASIVTQKAIKKLKVNSNNKADLYIKYSRILKSLYKTDSCFYFLDEAEKFYKVKNDKSKLFYILTIKAEVARSLVKRNLANNYIFEAEKLFPKNKNLDYKYFFLNRRIALLAEYYNNVPDSLLKIKEIGNNILKNQKEITDKSIIAYTLNEIGYLDFHRNPKNAQKYFLQAHQLAEKYNSKIAYVDISINLGRYYHQKENNLNLAIFYHNQGLKKAKEINNLFQIQQCYNEIKICYILQEDYKNAYSYRDSLANIDLLIEKVANSKKYELLENKFIIESKEKELVTSRKNQLLLLVILLFLFTGLATLLFYSRKIGKSKKALEKLNKENEFLISETNHRVNNNLQLISLLISETIRKNKKENKENIDLIRLQSKIQSIAILHRELYASKDKKTVDLHLYFKKIEERFSEICTNENIVLKLNVDSISSDSDSAMYLGLLVTELIMNSVKYAFKDDQLKNISIEIIKVQNQFAFNYSDNGQKNNSQEIHPVLVKQLCQQMGVHPEIIINNGFHLSFIKSIGNV
ncbi:hypothetical protein GFJ94_09425 [Flavobacterium sp. LMO8]|uniref:sensor histidine kinase n=1 Tax=Flavobacterium sp. LMO8 TaxID=2654244 RepID=UPI00129281D4|nr:sensor histidine kinase [Flavobacterium sp. LMO8]MQP25284.1 hypothetical protein [Flavobacterium sp. LMO8]